MIRPLEHFLTMQRITMWAAMGCQSPFETARKSVFWFPFTSNYSKDDWAAYKSRNMVKLQPMAALIDFAAGINFKLTPEPVELSKREEECLIWAARGKTYHDIAGLLNLSFASVKIIWIRRATN